MLESTLGSRREAPFTLRLMGGWRLSTPTRPRLRVTSRKARGLLAYLAHPPEARHDRQVLAALLWEDSDPWHARLSLRRALSDLRSHVADALLCEGDRVWLSGSAFEIDTQNFMRATSDSSAVGSGQAALLYGGDFLAGLTVASRAFTHWQQLTRQRLHSRMLVCRACAHDWMPVKHQEDATRAR
ncbi:MAG: hypothetical protein OXU20_24170 [Myxococcales bacterium]|nr:hypothetical protein [Myxococcales bacterium]